MVVDLPQMRESEGPYIGRFTFSRAEMIADGVVHVIGIGIAAAAGLILLGLAAFHTGPGEYIAAVLYVVSLLAALSISCAYNLWPPTPTKWILRRLDHAAIYVLIAGTYTPFLAQLDDPVTAGTILASVWAAAAAGATLKILQPGRFDRLAILFYLALGWSGVVIFGTLLVDLPAMTLRLILAGGIVYSVGIVFFIWHRLKFQTAVWHSFVVAGAGLHLAAVFHTLVVNRL